MRKLKMTFTLLTLLLQLLVSVKAGGTGSGPPAEPAFNHLILIEYIIKDQTITFEWVLGGGIETMTDDTDVFRLQECAIVKWKDYTPGAITDVIKLENDMAECTIELMTDCKLIKAVDKCKSLHPFMTKKEKEMFPHALGDLICFHYPAPQNKVWVIYVGEGQLYGHQTKKDDVFKIEDKTFVNIDTLETEALQTSSYKMKGWDSIECIKALREGSKPFKKVDKCGFLFPYMEELKFGDLIAFDHSLYMHWAVYVGKGLKGLNSDLKGKTENDDIFHITGNLRFIVLEQKLSDCVYGTMATVSGKWRRFNYLDGEDGWNVEKETDMIETINGLNKQCKNKWRPRKNNCEHIATQIRYGQRNCAQFEKPASRLFKNAVRPKPKRKFSGETAAAAA